jgi:hypothetical protein
MALLRKSASGEFPERAMGMKQQHWGRGCPRHDRSRRFRWG